VSFENAPLKHANQRRTKCWFSPQAGSMPGSFWANGEQVGLDS
jgi:hypothetical protein